ncbi:MAG: hypothetical protein QXU42_07385 [Thermoproteota archaeon]
MKKVWIATWLGEIYSKLFLEFESELFTFREALDFLKMGGNKLSVAFSKLHKSRVLLFSKRIDQGNTGLSILGT